MIKTLVKIETRPLLSSIPAVHNRAGLPQCVVVVYTEVLQFGMTELQTLESLIIISQKLVQLTPQISEIYELTNESFEG